ALALGPAPTPYIAVTGGSADLVVTAAGVAGSIAATAVVNLPGLIAGGSFGVRVVLDSATGYLAVQVSDVSLTFAGIATLTGDFGFARSAAGGVVETVVALSDVSVSFTGGGDLGASISAGTGLFVLRAGGVAGFLSGKVSGTAAGIQLSGTAAVAVNTLTNTAVDTSVTLDGRTVAVRFDSSPTTVFDLALAAASLRIGDFVTIEGSFSYTGDHFIGTGLMVFLGQGPARLDDGSLNPLAVGVLLEDATVALVRVGDQDPTYALLATGRVSIIGVPGVTLAGTTTVRFNNTGARVTRTLPAVPGTEGEPVELDLATGTSEFLVGDATLAFAGYALTGSFGFSRVGNDTVITIVGGGLSLAGAVSVASIDGSLALTASGLAASIDGELSVPALGLAGVGVEVRFDTRPGAAVPLSLTVGNLALEIAGQAIAVGRLTLTRQAVAGGAIATRGELADARLAIGAGGSPLLTATVANGWLVLTAAGLTGAMIATVTTSLPNIVLGAAVELQVNTTPSESGGLPAGPYLRVAATGVVVAVAGQELRGNLVLVRSAGAGGTTLQVTVSAASLVLGGGMVSLTNGAGNLVLAPAASGSTLSGVLGGTVGVDIPGVTLTGTLRLSLDTSTGAVGFTGTGVALVIAGQSLTGDLAIASTPGSLRVDVTNAALSFGGGVVTLSEGQAHLVVTTGVGISGTVTGRVAVAVPGVSIASQVTVVLDPAADPALRIGVAGTDVTIAGVGLHVDSLWFSQSADGTIRLAVAGARLALGPAGAEYVVVSDGNANLTATAAGLSGAVSATATVSIPGFASASAAVRVIIDTPTGYLAVEVTGFSLDFGAGTIAGDFAFSTSTTPQASETVVALSNVTATVGSGGDGV
ncbi:MAG: hypothetical protein REI45_16015, partial [Propionicimonas sp.]|nr:hypothetical protein [Propionicimonas sp.]